MFLSLFLASLFRLWHSFECLPTVADSRYRSCSRPCAYPCNVSNGGGLSPALLVRLLSSSHSIECLLLALHSIECLPPTPLNELETETYSNFNAIYKFENVSLKWYLPFKISLTRREKVRVDKSFKATHKSVSTWR